MSRSQQWKLIDNLKRKLFLKYELKNLLIKSIIKNSSLPLSYRYLAFYYKLKLPRWSKIIQIVNRCSVTGRSLSINEKTRYSRFVKRKELYSGSLPGFKRASW